MSKQPTTEDIIRSVADQLPVGVWVARAPRGEFVYANQTFAEILGTAGRGDVKRGEYAEPYGIHARDGSLYPEDRMPFVRALEERATVIADDIVIHRHDGEKVNIRAQAKPIFDDEGEITHVVIAFIDITREVRAEEARAESEARMSRAQRLESVGNLAAGIAHDFNNLLTGVKMLAGSLRSRESDDRRIGELATIEAICDSAAQLTRSLLTFAGRRGTSRKPLRIDDLVQDVSSLLRRTLDPRIEVHTQLEAYVAVLADRSQLEQVVMNLVMNARDAMPEGGMLELRTWLDGGEVVLDVADTGHGIPLEVRDRIFEPYFSTRAPDAQRGAGLGLATAYGIVEQHGGHLGVHDNPGGGTIMRVRLPATTEMPAPDEVGSTSNATAPARGHGLLLLVEDEPAISSATQRTLEALGYEVLVAEDGEEAVRVFEDRHAELRGVLLDLAMPRLGGRGAYEAMRAIDADVPVLLTSGYALEGEVQSVLDLGVRGFLPKPYDEPSLAAALSRMLGRASRAVR